MAEYTDSISVAASPKTVFEFVSDLNNLPKYLPTVQHASLQPGERVAVDGKANGHPYDSDGWFKVDWRILTMSWGSDGEHDYSGKMTVSGSGEVATVECSLRFTPNDSLRQSMDEHQGGPSAAMTNGLRTSLESIKQLVESAGGTEPSIAE